MFWSAGPDASEDPGANPQGLPPSLVHGLRKAEAKVREYLSGQGVQLPPVDIVLDPELEIATTATHRYPATTLYPEHQVKYEAGYRLVELLVAADRGSIEDLLHLNDLPLAPGGLEAVLAHPQLQAYSRQLLGERAETISQSIQEAARAGITDPTFVTLGEEVRAWKLLLAARFHPVRHGVDQALRDWFREAEVRR